jgi:hypothetical protein
MKCASFESFPMTTFAGLRSLWIYPYEWMLLSLFKSCNAIIITV